MEAGAASEIFALAEKGGVRLAPEQSLLTPFQRMVLIIETNRQAEEMQKEMDSPQQMNSHRMPSGGSFGGGETVTYVNENA